MVFFWQEFVTLQIVSTQKCDTSIKEDVELCVGGIAPIAWVATYRAKMAGITTENYTFILEERRQDPVALPKNSLHFRPIFLHIIPSRTHKKAFSRANHRFQGQL